MTTIAWDGKTVAADGKATAGGNIVTLEFEKLIVRHGRIYGLAGTAFMFENLIEWERGGADPEKTPKCQEDDSWQLLVFDGIGVIRYSSVAPYPEQRFAPWAFGSGADLAMGAMLHGASAFEAVMIAMQRDNDSGGRVRAINVADALKKDIAIAAE